MFFKYINNLLFCILLSLSWCITKEKNGDGIEQNKLCVGNKVEAMYKNKGIFYPGKILAVVNDNHYDIQYDDGDFEYNVSKDLIMVKSLDYVNGFKSNCTKDSSLAIGARVNARFQGGMKLYTGTITNCYSTESTYESTYDILYDDGDREYNVPLINIEVTDEIMVNPNQEKPGTNSITSEVGYTSGQPVHLRVGDGKPWKLGHVMETREDGALVIMLN